MHSHAGTSTVHGVIGVGYQSRLVMDYCDSLCTRAASSSEKSLCAWGDAVRSSPTLQR